MNQKETELKIKDLSADYIYQQAVGSLLLLLMSAMEAEGLGQDNKKETRPAQLEAKIREYTVRAEGILNAGGEEKAAALQESIALKKELLSLYEMVYSYFSQWNIFSTAVSDEVAVRKYREEHAEEDKIQWDIFLTDCHTFLEEAQSLLEQKNHMGQILKCIPLRMARDKYYQLVQKSLEGAFAGESEPFIESGLRAFAGFCFPSELEGYGVLYPDLAAWLEEKKTLQPAEMSDEALRELYEQMHDIFDRLTEIEEYFSCLLHDANSLILLFTLTYTFDELTERESAYRDMYQTVCEILSGKIAPEERAVFAETVLKQLEDAVEPVIDQANSISKEEIGLLEKLGSFDDFSEDTMKVLMTEEFIRHCFFADLNDELFRMDVPEGLPPASESFQKERFQKFTEKTKQYFETLAMPARRIAMQNLLGALPPVFTVHEVVDLVGDAMRQARTVEEKILIVDKVGMVFSENGFQYRQEHDDCDCGHDHHHDHDCGCGHEHHHHDHHCDCGHEHHHGHEQ